MPRTFVLCSIVFLTMCSYCASFSFNSNDDSSSSGVFEKIKSGLKLAGQFLGFDTASEIANLVTESFAKPSRTGEPVQFGSNIFSGFFRILGLQETKIGAIAINIIVLLSELLSSTLSNPYYVNIGHARNYKPTPPFEWILNSTNEKITDLLKIAKDPQLPDRLIEYLKEISTDEETGCVQLLICKTAPFLWGMQKAIGERKKGKPGRHVAGVSAMFQYLPSLQGIAEHADECERHHPACVLNY